MKQLTIQQKVTYLHEIVKALSITILLQKQINEKKQKSDFLEEKINDEAKSLKKIQKLADHYEAVYGTIETLKKLDGLPEKKIIEVLKNEVFRLQEMASSQREIIEKESLTNPLISISIPEKPAIDIRYPCHLFRQYKKYQKEEKEFKSLVQNMRKTEMNLTLSTQGESIEINNNGTRGYTPEHLQETKEFVKVGNTYYATYYLSDLPRVLYPDVMYRLMSSSLPFTISTFITPLNNTSLIKKIRSRIATLESRQRDHAKNGKMPSQKDSKSMGEMTELAEELVHEIEKGFDVTWYLTLEASSEEELKTYHEELKSLTDSIELYVTKYIYGQKNAFETMMPFNDDLLREKRFLQTTGIAYLTPFLTKDIYNPDGILLGVNPRQENLVFIDPFKVSNNPMRNSNMNILGVSGSGKSVTSKTIATRLYMKGTQVLVIDPEGEYLDYAKAMGGEIIQFSRDNGINPFSIYSSSDNLRNDMLDHIGALKSFFKFFVRPDRFDATELDDILMDLYEDYPKVKPTFKLFMQKLKGSSMYRDIGVLEKGSLQGVFNSERELHLGNDLVVFDISSLKDTDMKAPAMYLLTSLIWQLVDKNRDKRKMLFIDEAHNLLVDREVAVFYRKVVKEARKRNLGVVSITQNVEDFLGNEWGNGIITNSETKILLKQSFASLPLMEKIAPMNEEERMLLGNLPIGDFVLIREQEHIQAYMHVLPFEQKFVFTNPEKQKTL